MTRFRIAIFGAGKVGATAAFLMAREEQGDIRLVDKAEEIRQSHALAGSPVDLSGGDAVSQCRDADLVVITAGFQRKVDMRREDVLRANMDVVHDVMGAVLLKTGGTSPAPKHAGRTICGSIW